MTFHISRWVDSQVARCPRESACSDLSHRKHHHSDYFLLDEETQLLKERFFQALARSEHTSAMDVLMTELRQPFPELRHASFDVLRALAAQPHSWGVKTLFAYGGFADFLLDQKTEATKEAKEWKFSVIDALVGSPTASQLLSTRDPGLWDKIGNVFRGGPYSVGKPQPKVDLEAA